MQHIDLSTSLQEAGWKVEVVNPLIFGQGGCNYRDTLKAMTEELHLPLSLTNTILQRTQHMNMKRLVQIIATRRRLEFAIKDSPINSFPRHTHRENG